MCFVILLIKQRQHELTLALVPYPGYFGSEIIPMLVKQIAKNRSSENILHNLTLRSCLLMVTKVTVAVRSLK